MMDDIDMQIDEKPEILSRSGFNKVYTTKINYGSDKTHLIYIVQIRCYDRKSLVYKDLIKIGVTKRTLKERFDSFSQEYVHTKTIINCYIL